MPFKELPEAGVWPIEAEAELDRQILLAGASPATRLPSFCISVLKK